MTVGLYGKRLEFEETFGSPATCSFTKRSRCSNYGSSICTAEVGVVDEDEVSLLLSMFPSINRRVDLIIVDVGSPVDWVKINVRTTKDCFEVYALVPGLLREEVHVQSDPAGRLIISGEPEQPDNPWGVTPFKKVITLPSQIDPHQTSSVVTLRGQLFVRAPFEQVDL